MPIGYYAVNPQNEAKYGFTLGQAPETSLMTASQVAALINQYAAEGITGLTPVEQDGNYVGCSDCPFLSSTRESGCLRRNVNSSNCLRTKEAPMI